MQTCVALDAAQALGLRHDIYMVCCEPVRAWDKAQTWEIGYVSDAALVTWKRS